MLFEIILYFFTGRSKVRNMKCAWHSDNNGFRCPDSSVLSVPPNHEHRWDWLHRTGLLRIFRYLAVNLWSYVVSGRTWHGADRFSRNVCHQLQTYAVCIPEERRLNCLSPIRKSGV